MVHAGPRQGPRIVSIPSRHEEHFVDLAAGDDLFACLESALSTYAAPGITVEFVSGGFGHINFVHPAYGPDAAHPMSFTSDFTVPHGAVLRHGAATVGHRDSSPFCHIHASWTQADGEVRGGHLLPGTVVGSEGLRLRIFALQDARLTSDFDPETGFAAFAPESADASTRAATPTTNSVVSRVRPGEILDEAILTVCRDAGFDSAEVVASLGSTTGAVFTGGSAPWPAVEFTHLGGTLTAGLSDEPQLALTGEVVDVAGKVHTGTLKPGANPVAVTFELLVYRSL